GRADDYHYHATPFHLESVVGKGKPVAYALDGYPIYGLTEPDGSAPTKLDALNGHETPGLGYHYHGSNKYPYVNGGFHGEVTEREGQVDPQPRAQPMREAGTPLRGAKITGFTAKENKSYSLKYEVSGETRFINYIVNGDGTAKFDYVDGRGQVKTETYSPRQGGGGGNRPPGEPKGKEGQKKGKGGERPPGGKGDPKGDDSARQPWMKVHASEMDGNKDGVLTRDELKAEVTTVFKGYDRNQDSKLTRDEYEGGSQVRSAMGGFVKQHASEVDADHDTTITLAEVQATASRMFEKADTNGDGKLSKDELTLPPGYVATPPDNLGKK
ncbi:MAG: phospholipid-binding protein, partial [Verrucomicrobiota bacterium]